MKEKVIKKEKSDSKVLKIAKIIVYLILGYLVFAIICLSFISIDWL